MAIKRRVITDLARGFVIDITPGAVHVRRLARTAYEECGE